MRGTGQSGWQRRELPRTSSDESVEISGILEINEL